MPVTYQASVYADFKNILAVLPGKGVVYYQTGTGFFNAKFVAARSNYVISVSLSATPSGFSTDFPAAVQLANMPSIWHFPTDSVSLQITSSYSDFMALFSAFPIQKDGAIFFYEDTTNNNFTAFFISAESDHLFTLQLSPGSAPPSGFTSDWPAAVQLSPNAQWSYTNNA